MRPFRVVVLDELAHEVVKMLLPEGQKNDLAFLLDRLYEPLDVGVFVRSANCRPPELGGMAPDRLVEA